jgi:hypothetical protein
MLLGGTTFFYSCSGRVVHCFDRVKFVACKYTHRFTKVSLCLLTRHFYHFFTQIDLAELQFRKMKSSLSINLVLLVLYFLNQVPPYFHGKDKKNLHGNQT